MVSCVGGRAVWREFCVGVLQDIARFRMLGATLQQMPGWTQELEIAAAMASAVEPLAQHAFMDRVGQLSTGQHLPLQVLSVVFLAVLSTHKLRQP